MMKLLYNQYATNMVMLLYNQYDEAPIQSI